MKLKFVAVGMLAICLTGCITHRVGGYTLMSSKNVNLNSSGLSTTSTRVKGEHSSPQYARFDEATDRAIQNDSCAVALSDVATYVRSGFFSVSAIVEGNLVIDKNLPGCSGR